MYKQKVGHLATAKRAEIAKLQALQLANNNPVASAMVKKQAEKDYQVCLRMCGIVTWVIDCFACILCILCVGITEIISTSNLVTRDPKGCRDRG